ncbi:MAG TPA: VWA domain-containing protein [Pyrinomonadaceae bacterium]|nr:VWA domain-containing protein [Pyrinomonadaceae bacterium]
MSIYTLRFFCLALLCLGLCASTTRGQQTRPSPVQTPQNQTPQDQPDDVLRISTELVQTDVMVFDKQGRFVDNLKPEQFELKVDGKPQPFSFFERVAAGSVNEEAQLAAARGTSPTSPTKGAAVKPLDRGRTVLFFLDDFHLSFESLERARKSLLHFIDDEMGQNDVGAITSATGRIGFLQQFTGNKAVLRAAVARLKYQPYNVTSAERPPMSEYQALAIERNDQDALSYFIDQIRRDYPVTRDSAETMVRGRARQILSQASSVTTNTLATLDSLMRSASRLPGRKLVFFMSDGFFLDQQNGNASDRLRRITDAAARAGVVIYAMDTRGLVTGMPDASADVAFDVTGRISRVNMGEISASQEALFTLANETGGRAMINSNAPFSQIKQALNETAIYYLLVWRPDPASQHGAKYRKLEVSVQGHPEYKVRSRRGFLNEEAALNARENKDQGKDKGRDKGKDKTTAPAAPRTPDDELRAAIGDVYPRSAIPTTLSVNYLDLPGKGMILTLAMQVATGALDFKQEGVKQTAQLNVAGIVLNDVGKQVNGFRDQLNVNTTLIDKTTSLVDRAALERNEIIYNYQTPLAPGLYQVRVATRDNASGRTGSDIQWVEIPDLSNRRLSMSSLFIGERKKDQNTAKTNDAPQTTDAAAKSNDNNTPLQVNLSIDGRFASTSQLRFLTYIYNASRGPASDQAPDVALQIQIFRDNQPVLTNALRKVQTDGIMDLTHIPYAAEITLDAMPPGRYALQVTAIDRLAKASTAQRINFSIE